MRFDLMKSKYSSNVDFGSCELLYLVIEVEQL